MSESAQGTASKGGAHRDEIDAICDFVRRTLEDVWDAITPPNRHESIFESLV